VKTILDAGVASARKDSPFIDGVGRARTGDANLDTRVGKMRNRIDEDLEIFVALNGGG